MHWVPVLTFAILAGAILLHTPGAEGALDAVTLWNEDFTDETTVVRDGAVIGITAFDLTSANGTRNATVSDPTNPGDSINVTLYDDGTHGDALEGDGIYTGNFTVCSDGGTSGSCTSESNATIDIAEGDPVSVYVDLDGDGSHSEVTVRTDYTGPGMATPFEGGYVSGELIITITIIVEGEAELDPSSVTYSIDSGSPVAFALIAPNTYQAVIDTTLLTDGTHTVTTLSADEAGNVGQESFEIIVDNTVPDIEYGAATILPSGDVSAPVTVDDLHLDHSTIMWRWDGGSWDSPATSGTPATFDMVIAYDDMTPGNHSIDITAKDLANNSMTLILRFNLPEQTYDSVQLDPPTIDLTAVEPGDDVTVTTTVHNDGEVPADVRVDLVVDGGVVDTVSLRVDGNSTEDITLEWPDATEGEHDVQLVVTMPNATTGDDPVDTVPVTAPGGGPIDISAPKLTVGKPILVPPEGVEPGVTLIIPARITNPGSTPREASVVLMVDGKSVDDRLVTVPGGGFIDLNMEWDGVTSGEHEISIVVFMPNEYGTTPVDNVQVTDEDGGPVTVPEGGDWIEGFLSFLNPLYEYPPFSSVPDEWKPIFLPLVLVGIILGTALIGIGRARKKKKEAEVPETDLKPVEMPPITEGEDTAISTAPGVPIGLTAADPDGTGTSVGDPEEPHVMVPPPVVPPIASTTDEDDKGEPCVEIIRSQTRAREDVSDAQAAASDAKKKEREAQDEAESADRAAGDAERKAREAQKECDDARKEYEGHGVDEAEREAKEAEDRLKEMEDRLEELEGSIPPGDGVSLDPKPGYHSVGVGRGTMILPTNVYYRDAQAERDHLKKIDERWKEFKKTKKDLDQAREDAETERKEAEEAAEEAEESKKRMEEACEKAKKAKEEAERQRGAANDANETATAMGADVQAADEAVAAERAEVDDDQGKVDDCQDCLAKVRRTLARIEELKRRYESLKGGSALKGPKGRHSKLDAESVWNDYWESFKTLRDHAKALSEIKGFTEADLPSEFSGLWDWGGGKDEPVDYIVGATGTYAGMRAEDYVKAPIPTDTIKAVGGLYIILQAKLDPDMKEGATTLHAHLESREADEAARAFKRFPRALSNGIKGFEKLYKLAELDGEIGEALEKWQDCLNELPEAPDTPDVDFDKLCYQQCLDKLKELEEAERKMRELIDRAENCEPSGLDDKLQEANTLKGQLDTMGDAMDRTSKGLANYRKAMKAGSGCYISTAAYGTPLAPELDTLRGFRDRVLLPTPTGKLLVDHYYRTAPEIADRLGSMDAERGSVRSSVDLAVRVIHARQDRGPVTGALLSVVTVGVYILGSLQAWLLTRR
jgi:hypothetical protein